MSKNSHALDTQKKHETKWNARSLAMLLGQSILAFLALDIAIFLFSDGLTEVAQMLRGRQTVEFGWEALIIWRVIVWSVLWLQLWFYGNLLRLQVPIARRALTITLLTMGAWELFLLALLRIYGNEVFRVGNGAGTAVLLLLAITVGTMLTSRLFAISKKRSLFILVLTTLGVAPLFYSFVRVGSTVIGVFK